MATSAPDSLLIRQVLAGNTAAYSLLVARHQSLAFHIAYKLLRHRQMAEEATQDAFLKAYRNLTGFQGEAKFSTWLYRIVYTTAISYARRKQLLTSSLSDDNATIDYSLADDARTQLQTLTHNDQKVYLEAALATLPPDEALLITLYYQHEHTVEEISQIVNLGKANIKVKLLRIRRKLYAALHSLAQTRNCRSAMNYEDFKDDELLRTLLREVDATPKLQVNFTVTLMAAIETEAAEQAMLYKPLISRQAWRVVVFLVGLLLLTTGLLGALPLATNLELNELPFAAWLARNGVLQFNSSTAPRLALSSHLLAAGGICLIYLLLDKWHSSYWRQTLTTKQR